MENLIAQFCILLGTNYQLNNNACSKALLASYSNSTMQKEINASQNYENNQFMQIYNNIDKKIVYSGATIGALVNVYNTKEIKFNAPLKPYCDNLSVDIQDGGNQNYSLNWKWSF